MSQVFELLYPIKSRTAVHLKNLKTRLIMVYYKATHRASVM